MEKKLLAIAFALCVFSLPLFAIVNGRSLTRTLKELQMELQTSCLQQSEAQQRFNEDYERQHQKMIDVLTKAGELSILLYTQEQEMTFDLTYALKKASDDYLYFDNDRKPYDRIVNSLDIETARYAHLIEALRRFPPAVEVGMLPDTLAYHNDSLSLCTSSMASSIENEVIQIAVKDTLASPYTLDEEGKSYRDSCLLYASQLLKMHMDNRTTMMADSSHYQMAYQRMKKAYDYAESRYQELERYVFIEGQTSFIDILAHPRYFWEKTKADLRGQYSLTQFVSDIKESESDDALTDDDAFDNDDVEDDDEVFFEYLSSKGEKTFLLMVCALQLIFLALSWLLAFFVLWLICRYTRLRRYASKKKRPVISILTGTIIYFLAFAFIWGGDEYVQMGVRHINTFLWLLIAIFGSLLLRVNTEQIRHGVKLYLPTIFIALFIIVCRITFIPDKLMVLLFPPILFLIVLRQLFFCIKKTGKATSIDSTLGWISLAIYFIAFAFSFIGYTFVALLILVWWYFLLAAWLTFVCISDLLSRYKERWLDKRVRAMRKHITYVTGEDRESLLFGATWLYDLIKQVAIPSLVLISLPLCVSLSLDIFDFNDLYVKFYCNPFIQLTDKDGFDSLRISGQNIVQLLILFFILRYFSRAVHAIWRYLRYKTFMRKHNRTTIRVNEINLSLGNNIISALIWMTYALAVITVWHIPTGSMGLVAGGLSAGIGLALKDTINNFIYGIQLLGGRVRVGDWIECDGVRGKVTTVNYQCVQVETIEGTETSFLNSSLFGKNFSNLTRNNSYELTTIIVGVAYGTNVNRVREVLVEAMQQMRTKDHYGREIVDSKYGINVIINNMSESSVDIGVKQYVLVAERISYVDRAKEVIYEALNAADITIAFPQCDVHLIDDTQLKQQKPKKSRQQNN